MSELLTYEWVHAFLVPFMWGSTLFSVIMTVYSIWQWRRTLRRNQFMTCREFARYAVFESWVRAGARATPLAEEMEFQLRQQHARVARIKGERFYKDFVQYESQADVELEAVIRKLGGTLTHDKETAILDFDRRPRG